MVVSIYTAMVGITGTVRAVWKVAEMIHQQGGFGARTFERARGLATVVVMAVAAVFGSATTTRADPGADALEREELAKRPPLACNQPRQPMLRGLWNANLWTNKQVYYTFDPAVTDVKQAYMRGAMDELEGVIQARFIPWTNQPNFIYIYEAGGNWSYVGQLGGQQELSIYNWTYRYIIIHELMHALGVWHEQSRPDRAQYVKINYNNIQPGTENNFDIVDTAVTGTYDFASIMHYDGCAFSNCCPQGSSCTCAASCRTIACVAPYLAFQGTLGQRNAMSDGDKNGLISRYGQAYQCPQVLNVPPSITSCTPPATVQFQISATGSSPNYQWYRNNIAVGADPRISGAASPTLTITAPTPVDNGVYACLVSNTCGGASTAATLSLSNNGPVFGTGPAPVAAQPAASATFAAAAFGQGSVTYRWRRNGANLTDGGRLSGALTPTLLITGVVGADAGTYDCLATDACNSRASTGALLTLVGACTGDFNHSGVATVQDIFDFLGAYFAGSPGADFNGSGATTVQDIFDFLAAWFRGC